MFKMFAANKDSDLYLDASGNIAIVEGLEAVLQACEHATKTTLGEMVLAVNQGVPDFQVVWKGSPNYAQFEFAIRSTILQVAEVVSIEGFELIPQGNTLFYRVVIATTYGQGGLNGEL